MNTRFSSWLTSPTAATLLSEWRLSMKVSTAPSIITSRVSTNMGPASAASCLLNVPYLITRAQK